jgi:hypothetical protein
VSHDSPPRSFDEIVVYNGIAERTGMQLDRKTVLGRRSICRSLANLAATVRRLGDGYYYLPADAWPADTVTVNLVREWKPLS